MRRQRLKGMRAYLCGAMEAAPDKGVGWRIELAGWLKKLGIVCIDPANKPIDIVPEDAESMARRRAMKNKKQWVKYQKECRLMRCVDLRLVDIADILIVNVDFRVYSIGTWEEVTVANRSKKPIIVRIEQGKMAGTDWLFGTLPHQMIFSTWDEVKAYLTHIHRDDKIRTLKRWLFFDRRRL